MSFKEKIRQLVRRMPVLRYFYRTLMLIYYALKRPRNFLFIHRYPPGHYYSPLPDSKEGLARLQAALDQHTDECSGIDLKEEAQLKLLGHLSYYYEEFPFPSSPAGTTRYYYRNDWFGPADAIILYSIMRHYKPRRIIEIGSGFSSAALLDVNNLFLGKAVHFTFIEPHPHRLFNLLTVEDRNEHTILQEQVQDVPLEVFQTLSANDILFIDSSHIVKVGSDVKHVLFKVLPELKPGVIIHVHDILWPFEYPEWLFLEGYAWNESYFLRSFLQYNYAFEIMYFSSFMATHHADVLREKMPLCLEDGGGGSLWIKKTA